MTTHTRLRFWQDLTTQEFETLPVEQTIALLPLGATEQHGPHLPLSVDTDIVEAIVQSSQPYLSEKIKVLILPTQTIGLSTEHMAFKGTLSIQASTLMAYLTDIAQCVHQAGIRQLLIFNAHGGNAGLIDVLARDWRQRLAMLVVSASWTALPLGESRALFTEDEWRFGVHAGAIETSMMMHLKPHQVKKPYLQNFISSSQWRAQHCQVLGHGAKLAWMAQDLNPLGAAGAASQACEQKGQAIIDAAAQSLAALLDDMLKVNAHQQK